jgi:hypothetical protein
MSINQLTSDGAFTMEGEGAPLTHWLPAGSATGPRGRAHLQVGSRPIGLTAPATAPTLSLLDVGAWVDGDRVLLRSSDGHLDGVLELGIPEGKLGVAAAHPEPLFTIASALVLGRLGRALLHAAGAVAPDGKVWLLVGDTHAGKSTTIATLVRGGWGWLADDQVILRATDGAVTVEGWPRPPNLDAGYRTGAIIGRREAMSLDAIVAPPVRGEHPLGGILVPQVVPASATALAPMGEADAFAMLVRQSPWLLADVAMAPEIQRVLVAAAAAPGARLRLGKDSYGNAERLLGVLGPLGGGEDLRRG